MIPDSNSYVLIWFDEMRRKKLPYREPLVDDATVRLVKVSCSSMKQDAHVFVQAVETLEDYISAKGGLGDEDAVLSAVCAVFLCSKHAGGQSDLRTGVVKEFLDKLVGSRYTNAMIKSKEFDIFHTINGSLPLHTVIDDLKLLVEVYVKPLNLKVDLYPLCTAILQAFYLARTKVFEELKATYLRSREAYDAFKHCVRNRLYFPIGILLCAFKMTMCKNFLDLEKIARELGQLISIHEDHLHFLSQVILSVIENINKEMAN